VHFAVNDVGMMFFFALATTEVVEATAAGGAFHAWPMSGAAGRRGGGARRQRVSRAKLRLQVFDDEDLLAPSDEAELSAGHFLDGCGILREPPDLLAQPRVFGLLAGDCPGQLVVLAPGAQHDEQSLVADQGVDDDDRSEKEQQKLYDAPRSGGAPGFCRLALAHGSGPVPGHSLVTVQQPKRKYKRQSPCCRGDRIGA
jgi:hypothetical protein